MTTGSTARRIASGLAAAGAALLLAASAQAGEERGAGVLEDVDPAASTVTVEHKVFKLTSRTRLENAMGRRITVEDLEGFLGQWVHFQTDGRRSASLVTLELSNSDD
jgi:hypothetical protein